MSTDPIFGDTSPTIEHPKEFTFPLGYRGNQNKGRSSPPCRNRNGICAPGSCECRRYRREPKSSLSANYCENLGINDNCSDCCYEGSANSCIQNPQDFLPCNTSSIPSCNNKKCIAAGVCQCDQRFKIGGGSGCSYDCNDNCTNDKQDACQLPECTSYTCIPPSDCQCFASYKKCDSRDCRPSNSVNNFCSKPKSFQCTYPTMHNCNSSSNKPLSSTLNCKSGRCIGLDRCTCSTGCSQPNNENSPPWDNCCIQSNMSAGYNENCIKDCPMHFSPPFAPHFNSGRCIACDLCHGDKRCMKIGNINSCPCFTGNCCPFKSCSQQNFPGCNHNHTSNNQFCSCTPHGLPQYQSGNCCSCNECQCSKGCKIPPSVPFPPPCCNAGCPLGCSAKQLLCSCNQCRCKYCQDSYSPLRSTSRCNTEFSENLCNKGCQTMDRESCLADAGFGCIGSYSRSNCSLNIEDCPRCNNTFTSSNRQRGGFDTENSCCFGPNDVFKNSTEDFRRSCCCPPYQQNEFLGKVNDFNVGIIRAGSDKRPRMFPRKSRDIIIKPSGKPSLYFFSHQEKSTVVNRVN